MAGDFPKPYRAAAIRFHWTMFGLVLIVGTLGLLHDSWPRRTQAFWINLHALIGILLWLVLIARIGYRVRHSPLPLAAYAGSLARRLAGPVHWLLYGLMFVTPIIGVVTFLYQGRVFDFGFFTLDPGITKDRTVFETTEDVHGYLAYALFAVAGLHVIVVLWHHLILRDGVLGRMTMLRDRTAVRMHER